MAHEISFTEDGQAEAFFAMNPAWHGLGTVLENAPTSDVAIKAAHLDWDVQKRELQTVDGVEVPGMFATVRADTGAVLGVVSEAYKVVQNSEAFAFLDSLIQDGLIRYESAGALKGGRSVWVLARMPSVDQIVENDNCQRFVLFSTSHDGTAAIHAIPTSVRVVCANTLRIATSHDVGFKHTGDMKQKLDMAKRYLSQFDSQFTLFRDNARILAENKCSDADALEYLLQLFPECDESKKRLTTLRKAKVDAIRRNLQSPTNTLPGITGTWWAMFNAVTEAIDHEERKGSSIRRSAADATSYMESQFASKVDGTAADFKTKAFDLALSMAS